MKPITSRDILYVAAQIMLSDDKEVTLTITPKRAAL